MLQVDGGGVGAGVVGADDFDGAAIAGAVLFDDHDTVVGLLGGANARQTNHYHGDTVPFKMQSSVAVSGSSRAGADAPGQNEGRTDAPSRTRHNT